MNIGSKCFKRRSFYLYEGFKLTSTVPRVLLNVETIEAGQGREGEMRDRAQVVVVQRQQLQLGLTCTGIVHCHITPSHHDNRYLCVFLFPTDNLTSNWR